MVCRRMMPELFWSVPASLGSLSVQGKSGRGLMSLVEKKKMGKNPKWIEATKLAVPQLDILVCALVESSKLLNAELESDEDN